MNSRRPPWPHSSFLHSFVRKVALAGNGKRVMGLDPDRARVGADSVHVFPIGSGRMNMVWSFAGAWRSVMAER